MSVKVDSTATINRNRVHEGGRDREEGDNIPVRFDFRPEGIRDPVILDKAVKKAANYIGRNYPGWDRLIEYDEVPVPKKPKVPLIIQRHLSEGEGGGHTAASASTSEAEDESDDEYASLRPEVRLKLAQEEYSEALREYTKEKHKREMEQQKIFNVLLSMCTDRMLHRLEMDVEGYRTIKRAYDVVKLWRTIKRNCEMGIAAETREPWIEHSSALEKHAAFMNLSMRSGEKVYEFERRFDAHVSVLVDRYGYTLRNLVPPTVFNGLTTMEEKMEAVERALALHFVHGLDDVRFGAMKVDIRKKMQLGRMESVPSNVHQAAIYAELHLEGVRHSGRGAAGGNAESSTSTAVESEDTTLQPAFVTRTEATPSTGKNSNDSGNSKASGNQQGKKKKFDNNCLLCEKPGHRIAKCPYLQRCKDKLVFVQGKEAFDREMAAAGDDEDAMANVAVHENVTEEHLNKLLGNIGVGYVAVTEESPAKLISDSDGLILLDNGATVSIFKNEQLLTDVRASEEPLRIKGLNGSATPVLATHYGRFGDLSPVWICNEAIANIVSMGALATDREHYSIDYKREENEFEVREHSTGRIYKFCFKAGVYVMDTTATLAGVHLQQSIIRGGHGQETVEDKTRDNGIGEEIAGVHIDAETIGDRHAERDDTSSVSRAIVPDGEQHLNDGVIRIGEEGKVTWNPTVSDVVQTTRKHVHFMGARACAKDSVTWTSFVKKRRRKGRNKDVMPEQHGFRAQGRSAPLFSAPGCVVDRGLQDCWPPFRELWATTWDTSGRGSEVEHREDD